ncbi:NACHT domain-containing protein [Massilia aquatica]|uniref:ATP-binding protein n=1 Tax=Massilia aquatica TaxID=2609000 RepID=A0ABX0MCS4_9BURK|nr:hypothetical protein [Massilia aquatica]NHZ44953.1 hypothetical protein [Massilia aquatica]
MHIELHRTFRELLRDEKQGDDTRALSRGNATLTLPNLLDEPRVIILSEAGSGKTAEVHEAARRLKAEGKAAFFLRLEHVVLDFDTAFEEGTLDEFQAWLASSDQGWVLLDSIDESRLRSPLDFDAATRKVSTRLATAKQRTHLLITGRAPAWRPKTDLELCERLFPVADEHIVAPRYGDSETIDEHKQAAAIGGVSRFKIVTLEDLSAEQIKRFVEEKGIGQTQAFLDAIERADAWSFTARPQDLDELTGFWLDNGAIGSRLELMKNSVKRRLKEADQTRAEALPLPSDRALNGACAIAAALVLTNQQTAQIPDGTKGFQGLKLDAVLIGWPDREITTLLQRPLFTPDIYGTVRFHHRSVKEYLAAQWFLKLLSQEVSRRRVEELFFREQYGIEVVVPSLRPLLPWLTMVDDRILARVRRVAPEIVFEGGDPVQLPADVRSSILGQMCDQLASGESRRSLADFAAIQRFAAPDLTDTLRCLVQKHQANDDIVFFLMRMVWQGRLKDALPEAMAVACLHTAGYASRIAAFRAIADLGTPQDMAMVRKKFAEEGAPLDRRCVADLVSHIQHPDEQTFQWLMDCVPQLAEYNEFEGTGLSEEIASFFELAPLWLVEHGIELLHELLTLPPVVEHRYCAISTRYQWLRRAAGIAVRRLLNVRHVSALIPSSLAILYLLPLDGQYNVRAFDVGKLGLAETVQQWPELKWALFWHAVERERKSKEESGERVVDPWMALGSAIYVSFDANDFDSAVRAISERAVADDKLVALSLAHRLYTQTGREHRRNAQLKKAVGTDKILETRRAELMNPPKKTDELIRIEREHARWSRRVADRSKQAEKDRLAAPGKLESQLDTLRNPGFDDPSDFSRAQYYLYNRMRDLEKNSGGSKWTNGNWRALEREFGAKTSRAFRDGIVRFWRGHAPKLVSEGAAVNSTPAADVLGLVGLTIEAAETPGLFWSLSPAEAAVAFRYAMIELNGFPDWFPALSNAHLDMVKAMALNEVTFELQGEQAVSLQGDQENAVSHYIIYDLSHFGDWLWDTIALDIVSLLRTHPPKNAERLLHLLDIVQASTLPDATISELASEKVISVSCPKHLPLWMAAWTGVHPGPAIDALETHLAALENGNARTEFIMCYVTHLLGGGWMASKVRGGFRSPAILRRLYILVHEYVRSREDIDRANMGAYSPGLREEAQEARERLVGILREIPGRDAYLALKAISESHPDFGMQPWFSLQARSKAEADSERPAWSAEQVSQFDKEFERAPANHRELFDLAVLRLLDFKHELEDGDTSTASVLIKTDFETEVRNFISAWCNKSSLGRYVIAQEEELPDAKRPDLKWHCLTFKGPVPTELKIADKWTGPALFERLEGQLAGDYLRDDASSRGIYLLVYRGVQKHWQLPSGEMVAFTELVSALEWHWASVSTAHPRVEEIKVIGIDLTKRAITPLPKKKRGTKAETKNSSVKSTIKGTANGTALPQKTVSKKIAAEANRANMPTKKVVTAWGAAEVTINAEESFTKVCGRKMASRKA